MNVRNELRRGFAPLVLGLATASFAAGALSAELPKRKPGLWEVTIHMEGSPEMGPMQQCIDQNTDDLMQQRAKQGKSDCSVMNATAAGNKFTVHSVCKVEGSTATTDGVFEGAFDSGYKGTMKTRFSPPLHGMSESNVTQEARWLGPCKPGQKPGDVIMDMGKVNVNEMMKDPKMQEMMKKQQQQR